MFKIGDLVMHPTSGLRRVAGIRDDDIAEIAKAAGD